MEWKYGVLPNSPDLTIKSLAVRFKQELVKLLPQSLVKAVPAGKDLCWFLNVTRFYNNDIISVIQINPNLIDDC